MVGALDGLADERVAEGFLEGFLVFGLLVGLAEVFRIGCPESVREEMVGVRRVFTVLVGVDLGLLDLGREDEVFGGFTEEAVDLRGRRTVSPSIDLLLSIV